MKSFRFYLGLVFIIIGCVLLIGNFSGISGFAVFEGSSFVYGKIFVVLLVIGGIVLLAIDGRNAAGSLERRVAEDVVSPEKFAERFYTKGSKRERSSIILDTSAIIPYDAKKLLHFLRTYGEVYVPDSVIAEVKDASVRKILEENTCTIGGFEKYRAISRKTLEKTEKPQLRSYLLPYLSGSKKVKTRQEQSEIASKTAKIRKIMEKEGWTVEEATTKPEIALARIRDYLERHCVVSNADVDVLSMALHESRRGNHALIGEKDIDLRQAVGIIKDKADKLGRNIDYIEPYTSAA